MTDDKRSYSEGYAEAISQTINYISTEAMYLDGSMFRSAGAQVTTQGIYAAEHLRRVIEEIESWSADE